MAKNINIDVPDIGDFDEVPVIEVLVKEGDVVEIDQALIVLESDKSTMEVPASSAGVVRNLSVKVDDKVSKGDRICQLEAEDADSGDAEAEEKPETAPEAEPQDKAGDGGGNTAADKEQQKPEAESDSAPALQTVTVPDIGDFESVPIIELLVAEGDEVEADQALLVLESDKSTLEVPSPHAGKIASLKVKVGDKVSKGDALVEVQTTGGSTSGSASAGQVAKPASTPKAEEKSEGAASDTSSEKRSSSDKATPSKSKEGGGLAHAGPATRKFARELGVDLSEVSGSGPKDRILIEDVQRHVKARINNKTQAAPADGMGIPPIPAQDFSRYGEIEEKPLARIRKISAAHLHRSWLNVPHVTQNDEADITELEAFRKQTNQEGSAKLTLLPFIVKAVAAALRKYPEFGSSLSPDGGSLIMKHYCHIGFAADTPNGLVVPVLRDVWNKGISELAQESSELAGKARDGKLKPDEMKGGCFSISSLGGIGGGHFTPIVNAPEVAILGVSRAVTKPVWNGKEFAPRLMVPLSLSYDHRVIDGAAAARFVVYLSQLLGDIRRLSL